MMLNVIPRKLFGKLTGMAQMMVARYISKELREWLRDHITELEKSALMTETDADDAAVALLKGYFGIDTGGPVEAAISPEFKTALSGFLDALEDKSQTTPNDFDDSAVEVLRGMFNLHKD
jgi:hypothetical protein